MLSILMGVDVTQVYTLGQDSSSACLNYMQIIPRCEKQQERGVTTHQGLDSAWQRVSAYQTTVLLLTLLVALHSTPRASLVAQR